MNIIQQIKNIFKPYQNQTEDERALDYSPDGTPLFESDIVAMVQEELNKRKRERQPLELQWTLNSNFLSGNQYCDINTYTGTVEEYPQIHNSLQHEVFNQIAPLIETRLANIKKINYAMSVNPRTSELDDYEKAAVSTEILRYTQKHSDFNSKKNSAILWAELTGTCFFLSWWDSSKGSEIAREINLEFDSDGNQKQVETAYYDGDLCYGLLTPYEVFPESIFKQDVCDQNSIIINQAMSVTDIFNQYNVKVDGKSIDSFSLIPLPSSGGYGYEATNMSISTRKMDNAENVITYMERPSRTYPDGRIAIIIADKLIYYGKLPYDDIPIVAIRCKEVAGQFFGKSVIYDLIPLQRVYNGCKNALHSYIKNIPIGKYLAEEGAFDVDEYTNALQHDAVEYLSYRKGFSPPVPIPIGQLPNEVINEIAQLRKDMEYAAGVSQMQVVGSSGLNGVKSGTAIESLKEIDNTRLALTADNIRNGVKNLAVQWLSIYKRYASGYRVLNICGSNSIGNVLTWSAEDINSFDVEYDTENELIMSEEMQKQSFLQAFQMGLFTDENGKIPQRIKRKVIQLMKINGYSDILDDNQLQTQSAQRENSYFENGVIPQIGEFDEHEIHLEEHKRYVLQVKFKTFARKNPEYAALFINHIKQHQQIQLNRIQSQQLQQNQLQILMQQKGKQ